MFSRNRIFSQLMMLAALLFVTALPALAQDGPPATDARLDALLPAAFTLLWPVGLMLLLSSALPESKAPAAVVKLLVVWGVAALAYFAVGFAFHFGGVAQVNGNPALAGLYWEWYPLDQSVAVEVARLWGVIALRGWFLLAEASGEAALRLFLSHVSLVGVAAMLPAGALLQRERTGAALVMALLTGALIYPVAGNWLWGGGWLFNLGANLGLGHGLIDFAGATVVFLAGSAAAAVALLMFPPLEPSPEAATFPGELDEAAPQDEAALLNATPLPSAYLPILSVLGGGLLLVGWFGLAAGAHDPGAVNFSATQAGVSGLLAALAGALLAAAYSWFTTRAVNPLLVGRGLVAGLVVVIAGAPFVPVWHLLLAGAAMGLLLPFLIFWFDQRLRTRDELGLLATFGVSGLVSVALVGLLANGQAGQGWHNIGVEAYNGVAGQGVTGLVAAAGFAADWPGQMQAQLLGAGAVLLWSLLVSSLGLSIYVAAARTWARTRLPAVEQPPEQPADEQVTSPRNITSGG